MKARGHRQVVGLFLTLSAFGTKSKNFLSIALL